MSSSKKIPTKNKEKNVGEGKERAMNCTNYSQSKNLCSHFLVKFWWAAFLLSWRGENVQELSLESIMQEKC
jgi:hypothetical protein